MKIRFLLIALLAITNIFAQRNCGTMEKMEKYFAKNPEKRKYVEELSRYMATSKPFEKRNKVSAVVTIPVVVHVLYQNSTQNISDEQIKSQIEALNKDFRKLNSDFSTAVPAYFQDFASDMELVFCLATKDPNGNATSGIVRKPVAPNFDLKNDYSSASGDLAWDTKKYLNIWVGKFLNATDLGLATLPYGFAGESNDGIVIRYTAFGTIGAAESPFNLGWTATHEVGHYFGLYHIWSKSDNTSDVCGSATNTDDVNDTPQTYQAYLGKPVYPNNDNMCVNTPHGAMFMNYMDYVDDSVMAMFTNDQKTIVRNVLNNQRASLINSNACEALSFSDTEKTEKINLYPNPASQYISIASPFVIVDEMEVFDVSGKLVISKKNIQTKEKIDIRKLSAGIYYVRLYSKGGFLKSEKFIKK